MAKRKPPLFRVTRQGAPVMNRGWIVAEHDDVVALEIDLHSKWCVVAAITSGTDGHIGVWIEATDRSLDLHRRRKRDTTTAIDFPRWKGWGMLCTECCRYTLTVCLVKRKEQG